MPSQTPRSSAPRLLAASLAGLVASCASVQPVGDARNPIVPSGSPEAINWPEQYAPDDATFFVQNAIEIAAPPEVVWELLVEAQAWPEWYEGASGVEVVGPADGRLAEGATLSWSTMGLDFDSVVTEFEAPARLSWESRKALIQGYHAWLIVPTEGGCRVVTDESQFGFLASMQALFQPNKLRKLHDVWLAELKALAEGGPGMQER